MSTNIHIHFNGGLEATDELAAKVFSLKQCADIHLHINGLDIDEVELLAWATYDFLTRPSELRLFTNRTPEEFAEYVALEKSTRLNGARYR